MERREWMPEWPEWQGAWPNVFPDVEAAKREMERKREEEKRLAAYVDLLLADPEGRHFLRWLVNESHYFQAGYPESHSQAAFTEGSRAVGQVLFSLILKSGKREKFFEEDR